VALFSRATVVAQEKPDVVIFDEDDAVGGGYYDASVGSAKAPSSLKLDGPGDKLIILTNQAYTGYDSGLLQWRSAPGGSWRIHIAPPAFKTIDASDYSNLVVYLNGPYKVPPNALPSIGLESSPPNARSRPVRLGEYLPSGLDADTNTWQAVTIPLGAFAPTTGFSLSRLKDVFFTQSATDDVPHTLWLDNIRVIVGSRSFTKSGAAAVPADVVTVAGDRSIVLHWDISGSSNVAGFNVYRAGGDRMCFVKLTTVPLRVQSYADLDVTNGDHYFYTASAINKAHQESPTSVPVSATPHPFATDDDFLEYLQQTAFDYFWYETNPENGLIRDRSDPACDASVASMGFGLSAVCIAVDHGWLSRAQAAARVRRTLETLWEKPQGPGLTGTIGYRGWFYHFLDMGTALRSGTSELSSIDTALLLAGVLDTEQYFSGPLPDEAAIRQLAQAIYARVDWAWMMHEGSTVGMGWRPESGFIQNRWAGYNEAMILYVLGLGASTNALPAPVWRTWTGSYQWVTYAGQSFVSFPPLFGHQYSHCWLDFRHSTDPCLRDKGLTYFENSRRATLAQRLYCIANPQHFAGYSSNVWGLTSCDGPGIAPFLAYVARGAPPALNDDGTIAPTAAGGSLPFAPEYCLPALRYFYDHFRTQLWTGYGFRDAFNLQANWWGPHVLGIDQGPILLMAENFRFGRVWNRFMKSKVVRRGMNAAGFLERARAPNAESRN
jgi:hypothetical protein